MNRLVMTSGAANFEVSGQRDRRPRSARLAPTRHGPRIGRQMWLGLTRDLGMFIGLAASAVQASAVLAASRLALRGGILWGHLRDWVGHARRAPTLAVLYCRSRATGRSARHRHARAAPTAAGALLPATDRSAQCRSRATGRSARHRHARVAPTAAGAQLPATDRSAGCRSRATDRGLRRANVEPTRISPHPPVERRQQMSRLATGSRESRQKRWAPMFATSPTARSPTP